MREAVIVSTARTGLAKSFRGGFNDTEAPAMGGHVVRAAVERAGIDPAEVDDCIFGAAAQQGTQAYNIGRLSGIAGGLPDSVAGMSIERQCSSGLMSIATAARSIMCNEYDIAVAGGVESISLVQTKHKNSYRNVSKTVTAIDPTAYMAMLETAEVVSERYGISREAQDEYSLQSQQRTAAAQQEGRFDDEIVPMSTVKAVFDKETKETRIGVTLSGERGPPTITAIAPPPALAHGTLRVGDVIVAINDWSANGHSETTARLKRLQGRLRIRLQKRGVYSK